MEEFSPVPAETVSQVSFLISNSLTFASWFESRSWRRIFLSPFAPLLTPLLLRRQALSLIALFCSTHSLYPFSRKSASISSPRRLGVRFGRRWANRRPRELCAQSPDVCSLLTFRRDPNSPSRWTEGQTDVESCAMIAYGHKERVVLEILRSSVF